MFSLRACVVVRRPPCSSFSRMGAGGFACHRGRAAAQRESLGGLQVGRYVSCVRGLMTSECLLCALVLILPLGCSRHAPSGRVAASATPVAPNMLDYSQWIHLDAEDLAEVGIGKAYGALLPQLRKYVVEPARIEEFTDANSPSYAVRCNGKEFVIYEPENQDKSWGRATFVFFTVVNDQLAESEYRFYAINGGNDLGGMFLTMEQAQAAQRGLRDKQDWPYLPNDQSPWYGQQH